MGTESGFLLARRSLRVFLCDEGMGHVPAAGSVAAAAAESVGRCFVWKLDERGTEPGFALKRRIGCYLGAPESDAWHVAGLTGPVEGDAWAAVERAAVNTRPR